MTKNTETEQRMKVGDLVKFWADQKGQTLGAITRRFAEWADVWWVKEYENREVISIEHVGDLEVVNEGR